MARQSTVGQRLAAGFALPILLLIITGVVAYRTTGSLIGNDREVAHTHLVLEDLSKLLSFLKDAETGQRGYLLTGADEYLEPYRLAQEQLPKTEAELRQVGEQENRVLQTMEQVSPLIDRKMAELQQTIDLRRTQGLDAALKVVETGAGKKYMDEMRALIGQLDEDERTLLKERAAAAEESAASTKTTIWVTVGLALVLVGLIAAYISRSLGGQLRSAVGGIRTSATELQASATQVASSTSEQKAAISEATTTLKELAATSRQMSESAQRVTRIAEETNNAARTGDAIVSKAQSTIDSIRRHVDQIVVHMLDLGKKSQQVGGVLELINELAEQTNILAINATIESAGAGEAGRRFAVVADEIRKLADRVGSSTKEIRVLIEEIRSASNTTVMATEDGSKAVDEGGRQFTEVTSAFRQISDRVQTTAEASREIELGSRQQVTAMDQVSGALQGILQAAVQAESSTRQTAETSGLLTSLSNDLLRVVQAERAA